MNIIPHPEFLKKREKDLIVLESKLSLRESKLYASEIILDQVVKDSTRKDRLRVGMFILMLLVGFFFGIGFSLAVF